MQIWRHSHLSALVLTFISMHDLAFIGPLDENVHFLAGKEVHHFEVRVEWAHHRVDLSLAPAYSTEHPI